MSQSVFLKDLVYLLLDLVDHVDILHSRRHIILFVVAHFPNDVPQIFARTSFGDAGDYVAVFETCHRSDLFSDQVYHIF